MSGKCPLALPRPRIPDFHHTVLTTRDEAQVIGCQGPDAFHMAEEGADAGLGAGSVGVCERVGREDDEGVGGVGVGVLVVGVRLGSVGVPEADGGVEGTGEHVAWWCWAFGIVGPEGD
jgi:hypothetical protein